MMMKKKKLFFKMKRSPCIHQNDCVLCGYCASRKNMATDKNIFNDDDYDDDDPYPTTVITVTITAYHLVLLLLN